MSLSEAIIGMLEEMEWKPGICMSCPSAYQPTDGLVAVAEGGQESGGCGQGPFCRRCMGRLASMDEFQQERRRETEAFNARLHALRGTSRRERQH